MEAEKEKKLPLSAILLITGTCCVMFPTVMKFLDEPMPPMFIRIGIFLLSAGIVLPVLKSLSRLTLEKKNIR